MVKDLVLDKSIKANNQIKTSEENSCLPDQKLDSRLTDIIRSSLGLDRQKKVDVQHQKRKLTARERISILLDGGEYQELNKFIAHRATYGNLPTIYGDGVITALGKINGVQVAVYSQDFTAFGGSLGEMQAKKICNLLDIAIENKMPIIALNDSGGARIQEGVDSLAGYGEIFRRNVIASGVVPQIALIMGPSAGGAVYSPAVMDFIFMVQGTSYMFVTGPDVVKSVTSESVTLDQLGGARVHSTKSGVANFVFKNDVEAILELRKFMAYLPKNNMVKPQLIKTGDSLSRKVPALLNMVPDDKLKPYDMTAIIKLLVDNGSFLESLANYAKNIITGFARFDGISVGIIANQPLHLAGCLDINASCKASRFIRFCDAFSIPIVSLIDVPGFLPGTSQEYDGIIRHGAKMIYAYAEATVPKISLITRKAYGGAYIVMSSCHLGGDVNFAWDNAEIAVMGADAAASVLFRNCKDPQVLEQLVSDYKKRFANPYVAVERGFIDDIIKPEDTRKMIISSLNNLIDKSISKLPWKKHGNIPL